MTILNCRGKSLDLTHLQVMGILNITPDSFSDGGDFFSTSAALQRARVMAEEGAAIIDIGGESTRPGAQAVDAQEELRRVIPVIEAVRAELPVIISIDTSKPKVMRAALDAGAHMVNDVRALESPGALEVMAGFNQRESVPVCLMHMRGEPRTMQQNPLYTDVVAEVRDYLGERVSACERAGIARERIVIDPGFGFGKTVAHNLSLLKHLAELARLGLPVLAGLSRKSMLGVLLDAPPRHRLYGSLAAAVLAVEQGARILRVHDVRATVEALKIYSAVQHAD
ncbi:MAG: dihydropteroate synthase [Gammaproteobacteria bacterium]|nr:dihydropteroate synthase [Gammaproteobacteria bacterium]